MPRPADSASDRAEAFLPTGKNMASRPPVALPGRRRFCAGLGAGLLGWATGGLSVQAAGWPRRSGFRGIDQRHLWIRQAGRREALLCAFRDRDGAPLTVAVNTLSWLFRDWRDGDQGLGIDIRLFDLLATVQTMASLVEARAVEITLTSGYRTPERNRTIEGAAANSQHIHGRAADIVLPGVAHGLVRDIAEIAGAPGLGRYAGFTHLDVGPPGRRWHG